MKYFDKMVRLNFDCGHETLVTDTFRDLAAKTAIKN